jgi:hypothetical protein
MALINCPECKKEISDKAISCPNCGLPLNISTTTQSNSELLKFPTLPDNLSIGKQIVNWGGDSAFDGEFQKDENIIEEIPTGKIKIILHTHGIKVANSFYVKLIEIHNSQIISIKQTTRAELQSIDKSVVGRAVVGGLILGPLGAVIGGMSGIGSNQKLQDKSFLVINYWDVKTKTAQTLLVGGEKNKIQSFISRKKREETVNQTQNRQAENNKGGCLGIFIIPISFAIMYYFLS